MVRTFFYAAVRSVLVVAVFVVAAAHAPHVYAAELLGHWALDETVQGSTVVDSTGNNNGTPGGTGGGPVPSTDVPSVKFYDPGSYRFNGTDQNVEIASSFRSAMSVTFWFKPEAWGRGSGTGQWYEGSGMFDAEISGVTEDFGVNWSDDRVVFGIGNGDTSIHSGELSLDQWYDVAATWDAATGHMMLYVDGSLVASSDTSSNLDRISTNVRFGELLSQADQGATFNGYMDDIRTYDTALDQSQVESMAEGNAIQDPIVTALSPANGATGVATGTNLSITFGTTTVATSTGTVELRKTSDSSLVESFSADSPRITRSQPDADSTMFTIDPTDAFADSTGYYLSIASTTFEDGIGEFYTGTVGTTTWAFTTGDFTPPTFSNIAATSTASTSASVSWTTNENASTKVVYGLTTGYGFTTSETDTSSGVTSHSVAFSSLLGCATYHYAVVSRDDSLNAATSSDATFATVGCTASSTPTAATSTAITSSSGGSTSLKTDNKTFAVSAPADATATSSSFVIQIQALPSDPILDAIGKPDDAPDEVGATVFDVKAIINGDTILDSFDAPVTISYQYTDQEISGLDESTLKLYHYHDGSWQALDDCSVDAASNTITCTTPSFSTFAIFGTPVTSATDSTAGEHASGYTIQGQVANLLAMGKVAEAAALKAQWYWLFPEQASVASAASVSPSVFLRDLFVGTSGNDVLALQKFLIAQRYAIADGSTGYFGRETRDALATYQKKNGITPPVGYFGPITRAHMSAVSQQT